MARYDWPSAPYSLDDPIGRAEHLARFRPSVDLTTLTGPLPEPLSAPKRRRGAGAERVVAHTAPVGAEHLWLPIGPSVMRHGQATDTPNVAGRIRDMQVSPDGARVYAASASGGVWYSEDAGLSWRPLDDWQESVARSAIGIVANSLACGAVHVIWGAFQAQDDVWVGTGEKGWEGYTGAGGAPGGKVAGVGFLHSGPSTTGWEIEKGGPLTGAGADPDSLRGERVYRIVGDPGADQQLVAATTRGLYVRPAGGSWTKSSSWTFGTAIDVAVTRKDANVRIWVASYSKLRVAETTSPINPAALTFHDVTPVLTYFEPATATVGALRTRLTIAANQSQNRLYVLGRRNILPDETKTLKLPPAAVWMVDAATANVATADAKLLLGIPVDLFGSKSDQSDYDMCIAAHPTLPGTFYIGGSTFYTEGQHNASLYRCTLVKPPPDPPPYSVTAEMIGVRVHPDVQQLRVGQAAGLGGKHAVWVGCDGGLFRSLADGDPKTFENRNNGLAVLEPGYVASHPTNPGIVAAGFQDNGTAVRAGDTLWWQDFPGDGGGVVYDPAAPNRYFRQYTGASWSSSDGGGIKPVFRRNARRVGDPHTSEELEDDAARFYTGADSVVHPSPGGDTHLAFGTNRVWYSRDWGRSWVTLPTGTDPRAPDRPNLDQDVFDPKKLTKFTDRVGSTDCCSSDYSGTTMGGDGIRAVKFGLPSGTATHDHLRVLSLYDILLVWFIGTRAKNTPGPFSWAKIHEEPIRAPRDVAETDDLNAGKSLLFLPAPGKVSDLAVHDPDRGTYGSCYVSTVGDSDPTTKLDTLWFFDGDITWYPCGFRTTNLARGTWDPADSRVTAPVLGVLVDRGNPNVVYAATSVGVVMGVLKIEGAAPNQTFSWTWRPFMNGLPEAVVHDLSLFNAPGMKLLRAALQARGVWEVDLLHATAEPRTYLRLYPTDGRRVVPTPLTGPTAAGEQHPPVWDNSPDIYVETGAAGTIPLTEVELAERPRLDRAADEAQLETADAHPVVHVLVHHRWSQPAATNEIRVALVKHPLPAGGGDVPLGGLWTELVTAADTGNPPASLSGGWSQASPAALWQNPLIPVDVRVPVAVSFDVDLPAGSSYVLLAVVMSDADQIDASDLDLPAPDNTATTVSQLVRSSPHAAAKTVKVSS